MAEYNKTYLDLRKRLKVLKLLNESDQSLSTYEIRRNKIDALLKELDIRYSDEQTLVDIEAEVEKLEK